jgi:hypothetical protein
MNFLKQISVCTILLSVADVLTADVIRLREGNRVKGTFLGANTRVVQFMEEGGGAKSFAISDVLGIDFEAAAPSAPSTVSATTGQAIVIPTGTAITVRLLDGIDSTRTSAGQRYRGTVDDPVTVGNRVVIPRGADCTVQIAAVEANKEVAIKLYDVTINGKARDVVAEYANLQAQGTSNSSKSVRRAAILGGTGAAIGGIAGGGRGAAIGAVSGVGLGAISGAAAKGKTLNLPPETRLSFELRSSLPLN